MVADGDEVNDGTQGPKSLVKVDSADTGLGDLEGGGALERVEDGPELASIESHSTNAKGRSGGNRIKKNMGGG